MQTDNKPIKIDFSALIKNGEYDKSLRQSEIKKFIDNNAKINEPITESDAVRYVDDICKNLKVCTMIK